MRRRLLGSTVLIALAAVLLLGIPLGVVGGRLARGATTDRLEREADDISRALDDRIERREPVTRALLGRLAPPNRAVVVRLPGGTVVRGGARLSADTVAQRAPGEGAQVSVLAPAGEVDRRTGEVWLAVLGLSLAAVVAAVALALAQSRRLARPLERLARRSARLGTPAFAEAGGAGTSGLPELDAVGGALDRAADRIARLLAREREFSTNASHQLRTPLTALRMHLEELERLEPRSDDAHAALVQADRLQEVIAELERLARDGGAERPDELDASTLLREAARAWEPRYAGTGRRLVVAASGERRALGAAEAVRQALDVLLENALRHGGGAVTVEARDDRGHVVLAVADEGAGVPAELASRVLDRGVSLRGGTGLGLAVARDLLEASGGELRVSRGAPGNFEIVLPAAPRGARA